jgi:diamine N-acetyltransferase
VAQLFSLGHMTNIPGVHLRSLTRDNLAECLNLHVADSQTQFVALNAKSLAEAYVNPYLFPLAIYPAVARGHEGKPPVPMVGFCMYELEAGVGFILRLMISHEHQRRGYGRAAVVEVIRRLRLHPEVEQIATSYKRGNKAAAHLYQNLGFVPWEVEWAQQNEAEIYVRLG